MPPLPEINNVFRCAINWSIAASANAVNVIHVRSLVELDGQEVGEAIRDAAHAAQWGPVISTAHAQTLTVTPLDGTSASTEIDVSADTAWVGQTGGQYVPQVAGVVKFTTAQRGRSKRGRLFMPFVSEGAMIDGVLQDMGPVQTGWEDFLDDLPAGGVELVIASYLLESAQKVESVLAETRIGTQRRRNRRP